MNGMIWTGLDYNTLPIVEARLNVPRADRAELFANLRIMEAVARTELNKTH